MLTRCPFELDHEARLSKGRRDIYKFLFRILSVATSSGRAKISIQEGQNYRELWKHNRSSIDLPLNFLINFNTSLLKSLKVCYQNIEFETMKESKRLRGKKKD